MLKVLYILAGMYGQAWLLCWEYIWTFTARTKSHGMHALMNFSRELAFVSVNGSLELKALYNSSGCKSKLYTIYICNWNKNRIINKHWCPASFIIMGSKFKIRKCMVISKEKTFKKRRKGWTKKKWDSRWKNTTPQPQWGSAIILPLFICINSSY